MAPPFILSVYYITFETIFQEWSISPFLNILMKRRDQSVPIKINTPTQLPRKHVSWTSFLTRHRAGILLRKNETIVVRASLCSALPVEYGVSLLRFEKNEPIEKGRDCVPFLLALSRKKVKLNGQHLTTKITTCALRVAPTVSSRTAHKNQLHLYYNTICWCCQVLFYNI